MSVGRKKIADDLKVTSATFSLQPDVRELLDNFVYNRDIKNKSQLINQAIRNFIKNVVVN